MCVFSRGHFLILFSFFSISGKEFCSLRRGLLVYIRTCVSMKSDMKYLELGKVNAKGVVKIGPGHT